MSYAARMQVLLNPAERCLFQKLNSPVKIQDFLDALPINFELRGETYFSPRRMLQEKRAHCMEGALFAAAVFAYHGKKPLLMDLQTADPDEDHVVALFREDGHWGAISKTNHSILRYRDAVYKNPRELAMSYFHEYFWYRNGKKSLRTYSAPFDLSNYAPAKWVVAEKNLEWIANELDWSRHFPLVSKKSVTHLRPASKIERKVLDIEEWTKRGEKLF